MDGLLEAYETDAPTTADKLAAVKKFKAAFILGGEKEQPRSRRRNTTVDWESIRQAHANVTAGGCFAMGLRYAGTASGAASQTLQEALRHFQRMREVFI
jgi:hypothetical protein